jgi:pterin-4a-carbinolamine dehydratase
MITPKPHQIEFSQKLYDIMKVKGYAYLAGKPRSGKTLTAILTAERSDKISSVLVLTKKAAISGWHKFTEGMKLKHTYTVTNYEQAHKLDPKKFDFVIIDESHNLGTLGKPSQRIKTIKKLCWQLPHLHLSGTAIVESPCGIYHQMAISKFSPFKMKNFYDFHRLYGDKYFIKAAGREIAQYDRHKPELMDKINEFTIYMTQEDAGIDKSLQAIDQEHYVTLSDNTKKLYNELQKDKIIDIQPKHIIDPTVPMYTLVCDTVMKLRTSLHMLESGIAKVDDEYIELGNTEKIDYIKETFGDEETTGIMCHFVGERKLLEKHFKKAKIYSSSSHAEGVDLSHLSNFVIMSSDYSGAKFIQRRDRIINTEGSNTLTVHHILVKKGISEQVYKKVSKKEDFNNSTYERTTL